MSRRGRAAPQVFEEGALGAEHLDGARRQPRESVEPARRREETGGEVRPEQVGEIGGAEGSRRFHGLLKLGVRTLDLPVELREPMPGRTEGRVERSERGVRLRRQGRADGPGVVGEVEIGGVPRDPAREPFPDEVLHPVEVGDRSDGVLDMDRRVPRVLERSFRGAEKGRAEEPRVDSGRSGGDLRPEVEVEPETVGGETSVPRTPLFVLPLGQDRRFLGGELARPSKERTVGEGFDLGRGERGPEDDPVLEEERSIPGGHHDVHGGREVTEINRPARLAPTMAIEPDLVRAERRGRTLLLTLDHPPVNVLSRRVLTALAARLREAEADPEVRAVVLASAAEKAFAAGADIREMAPMGPAAAHEHGSAGQAITRQIERLPLPVIAAVHGVCLGGGCEISLACDFILASEDAVFGQPEVNLGVMPGWGGTRRLPRRVGPARARRGGLTGRPVPAAAAFADGLVERVVPRAELLPEALALAEELAAKPPLALAAAKYALLNAIDPDLDAGLDYELELWARLFGTLGQKEGMRAFLDKRPLRPMARDEWAVSSKGFPWGSPETRNPPGKRNKD